MHAPGTRGYTGIVRGKDEEAMNEVEQAGRIYEMALAPDSENDIDAVFRFLAGTMTDTYRATARTIIHVVRCEDRATAIQTIVRAIRIASAR